MPRTAVKTALVVLGLACAACEPQSPVAQSDAPPAVATPTPAVPPPAGESTTLVDEYIGAWFEQYPQMKTYYGLAGARHHRLSDNSLEALAAWEAREDAWLERLRGPEGAAPPGDPRWVSIQMLRELLLASVAMRSCRMELWSVSPQTGWQVELPYIFEIQPIETPAQRDDALARLRALPAYIDNEIDNARAGLAAGYSVPRHIVGLVIDSVKLLATDDTPLLAPARDSDVPKFADTYREVFTAEVVPAMNRYQRFLDTEYAPRARETLAVAALPDGEQCYRASILYYATVAREPREIHELGLAQMDGILAEMGAIARRSFDGMAVADLLELLVTDPAYAFSDRQAVVDFAESALARANQAAPQWFGTLPRAAVVVEPYPAYREATSTGEYNAPSDDGTRPGVFYIATRDPTERPRAGQESLAFHETIPGHHLQTAIAMERGDRIHPIQRYMYNSGYAEGWGLYSERLADEMGLYTDDVDRIGMLSDQAARAARLVIDTGIHAFGWNRQQAVDYMRAHTTWPAADIESEIDRYIIWPGQAVSYMLGMLEIQRLRTLAQSELGEAFDIRQFHDRVLEDGSITLSMLDTKISRWIERQRTDQRNDQTE